MTVLKSWVSLIFRNIDLKWVNNLSLGFVFIVHFRSTSPNGIGAFGVDSLPDLSNSRYINDLCQLTFCFVGFHIYLHLCYKHIVPTKSTPNAPNQEINATNAIEAFGGYECLLAFPVWHLSGLKSARPIIFYKHIVPTKSTSNALMAFVGTEEHINI